MTDAAATAGDRSSTHPRAMLIALAVGLMVFVVLRIGLSQRMELFGDEAFYWMESQRLALAYSDLPPMTALLIRLGTDLFGSSYLGVRSLFLLIGTLIPLLVYGLAREFHGRAESAHAALLALALPLVASSGVLALPDVPLNALALLMAWVLVRALRTKGLGWWSLAGLIAALGFATHYRFAVPAVAGLLAVLSHPDGRRQLATLGPWCAAGLASLGLLPLLLFNRANDWVGFQFQLADRHPWTFQPKRLVQPLEQALVSSPLLYLLLLIAAVWVIKQAFRSRDAGWALIAWLGVLPALGYFLAGLWADPDRTTFHWPLVGYLILCVALPSVWTLCRRWLSAPVVGRTILVLAPALGFAMTVVVLLHLASFTGQPDARASSSKIYPDNAVGWRAVADTLTRLREDRPGPVVADNFMLAAALSFELDGEEVATLDHPLNEKHGRAAQLAIWGLSEGAGERTGSSPTPAWVVTEETALDLEHRPGWARDLCHRFASVSLIDELVLHGGRKRFNVFAIGDSPGLCELPAFAYLDEPLDDSTVSGTLLVSGWAFRDGAGLEAVEILVDDGPAVRADYGISRPGVQQYFPDSNDPNHPRVGFQASLDLSLLEPGWYDLSVRSLGADGYRKDHRPIQIRIADD